MTKSLEKVPDNRNLEVERNIRVGGLTNKIMELIVFPTEQCNFRCTYCYEDFSIGRMKDDVIDGICNLMKARAMNLERLHLSYFGGEPLLNMKAIRKISDQALSLKSEYNLEFASSMTTNAFLLDANRLQELVALGCTSFQISLDGWEMTHDETRIQRNGTGSFATIWRNLLDCAQTNLDFHFLLRIHLLPENIKSVFELVRNINNELNDDRFEVMFKKVGNWGGNNLNHPIVFEDGSITLSEAYRELVAISKNRVSDVGADEFGGSSSRNSTSEPLMPYVCYASKANSFAIRANGRVNKCTVALNNPKNDIGIINQDGTLSIDSEKFAPWIGGISSLDEEYLGCPASIVLRNK